VRYHRWIVSSRSVAILLALGAGLVAAPTAAAAQMPERAPKTPAELQRQSGHVWDMARPLRVASVRPLRARTLRRALDDFAAGRGDLRHDVTLSWGEFLSGTGKPFLAIALDRETDADLGDGQKVTVFGELLDERGGAVRAFEADDRVEATGGRSLVEVALPLPSGVARARLGIAVGGEVRWLIEQPMAPQAIDTAAFALSRPVLSLDVRPLSKPQGPDDPFCFGGLRVTPRGDRTFRSAEQPWLFVVVRTPGIGAGATPQLAAELVLQSRLEGASARRYPVAAPTPAPLRGFEGQWGLGIPLPVDGLQPGEYDATLRVTEKASGASATATTSLTVVDG
jgi:hypothetical protein